MNQTFWARMHGGATHFPIALLIILATVSGLAAVGIAFATGAVFQPGPTAAASAKGALVIPPDGTPANQGYQLFMRNCAHCHGSDARGEEGPNLHGVAKSDQRIASIIQDGIKGEMPKFGAKLNDSDTRSIIAFIRMLKRGDQTGLVR